MYACKNKDNSPPDRDHRFPSLSQPWSGYESPEFLQKTPRWASADRGSRFRHTLIQQHQTVLRRSIVSFCIYHRIIGHSTEA